MNIKNKKITFGLTSAFYTYKATISEIKRIIQEGGEVFPIMSTYAYTTDSKFGRAEEFIKKIEKITQKKIVNSLKDTGDIESDIMVIAPCSRQ